MIQLSPTPTYPMQCPTCSGVAVGRVRFAGAVTLAEALCPVCRKTYRQTLPNGQFNRFPVAISTDAKHVRVAERGRWLVELVRKVSTPQPGNDEPLLPLGITISSRLPTAGRSISPMLLLCLDRCYGHALMMLFNAQRHHEQHPNRPIIAVVPRSLAWLVPGYVAETWVVDQPLSSLDRAVPGFDAFVKQQLTRFGTVWFSHAHIHFDHRTTRFSDFTRTPKFDLAQFDQGEVRYVTFVLREDRLWLRYGWERLLYRICQRSGLLLSMRSLWVHWQVRRYRQLAHVLRQTYPAIELSVTGLTSSNASGFGDLADDLRLPAPLSAGQERTWCDQYARSHVVVGMHGSGMLLPTSLAAGFVNLLPPDKLPHYAEDILLAHDNPIHQTLLGRFLPTDASPRQVAVLIASILTEFPVWLAEVRERKT
ncbi:hypothetical protein [Fibrella forsythiae]|uniref:Glycosyltransferase family 61 protein n=1 Tax=Fibrella forsythiae TaxID=2817061 RepID=A0ABS3JQZ9_9BACT|nr:hypothetical protein [Fibrella forsythiae]MBO0951796.1 hypothetical protein [Fibrella forsythiae]